MRHKSLVSKFDKHLSGLEIHYHDSENIYVYNGYAYIDFQIIQMGAIFFFVSIEKWVGMNYYSPIDVKKIIVKFDFRDDSNIEELSAEEIRSESFTLQCDKDDAYDNHWALKMAERKAFEFLNEE